MRIRKTYQGNLLIKQIIVASLVMGLGACNDAGKMPERPREPVIKDGKFSPTLKGAWRVLGEGRLIDVNDQGITQFQETNSICYADRQTLPLEILQGYLFLDSKTSAHVRVDLYGSADSPSSFTLESLTQIPAACLNKPPADPATTFTTMWDIFNLDYGFFKERNIDWAARYADLAPKAALAVDDDALQSLLIEAMRDIVDDHVSLIRVKGDQLSTVFDGGNTPTNKMLKQAYNQQTTITEFGEFEAQWRSNMHTSISSQLTAGSAGRVLNGAMVWGKLPGNIGYIELSRMVYLSDSSSIDSDLAAIRAEMDRAIQALADTKAIIMDIAVNDGGYDIVSAEVAGSFADSRRLAFTVSQHRPQGRAPQKYFVEPKGSKQYLKPVYLLTTDRTVSAGDTLTLMMRQLPNVTQVGQATSGSMSNKLTKSLPGNFMVTLANESFIDPAGVLYEGRGIPPKVSLQVFNPVDPTTLDKGHAAAIAKLSEIINQQ